MIKVLVVEDSPTARPLLVKVLEEDPEIKVAGQATGGHQAVEMAARLRPDLVTMDVVMPDMDGLEPTRRIMAQCPTPILFVTAHAYSQELNVVFEAMKAGALDIAAKPAGFGEHGSGDWNRDLVTKLKALASGRLRGG